MQTSWYASGGGFNLEELWQLRFSGINLGSKFFRFRSPRVLSITRRRISGTQIEKGSENTSPLADRMTGFFTPACCAGLKSEPFFDMRSLFIGAFSKIYALLPFSTVVIPAKMR